MIPELSLLFLSAAAASAGLSWVARKWAPSIGLLDEPDGKRKLHRRATPLGGGIAIATAFAIVLAATRWTGPCHAAGSSLLPSLLLAGIWLTAVGTLDDLVDLRVRSKLVGQLLAVGILVIGGLRVDRVDLFGRAVQLGWLAVPVTAFWLMGAINSINLLDGMDGLASSLSLVMTLAITVIAGLRGDLSVAGPAVVFAGALGGFLLHNLPPARIFLGDGGSLVLGLVVGAFTILAAQGDGHGTAAMMPLVLWTIPILDCGLSIVRRTLAGRHLYAPDRDHLHHRLLDLLGSDRRTLAVFVTLSLLTATVSIASLRPGASWLATFAALFTVGLLAACQLLPRGNVRGASGRLPLWPEPCARPLETRPFPTLIEDPLVHGHGSESEMAAAQSSA